MKSEQPTCLSPASELARRCGVAPRTLVRRLSAAGVQPVALLIAGSRPPLPLFNPGVVKELTKAAN